IVVAVADEHDDAANVFVGALGKRRIEKLFRSHIERVIQGRTAAGALISYRVAENADVVRVILNHLRLIIERHKERLVLERPDHTIEKVNRGVLLELEARANAV